MIIDNLARFSVAQAITATAASTSVIDHGSATDVGPGTPVKLDVEVVAAFNTLTSLDIALQTCATVGGTYVTLWTKNFLLAALTVNTKLNVPGIPAGALEFLRLNYTVNGSNPTLGTINAQLIIDDQANACPPGSP